MTSTPRSFARSLGALIAVELLVFVAVAAISLNGAWQEQKLLSDLAQTQLPLVRSQSNVDMMHDGLRAVVFRAVIAASRADASELTASNDELKEFSKSMRDSFTELLNLPHSPEVGTAIAKVKPDLDSYLNAAAVIVARAGEGSDVAMNELPKFQSAFKSLEESLGTLGELIDGQATAAATDGVAKARGTSQLIGWTFIIGALAILLQGLFFSRTTSRRLSNLLTSLGEVSNALTAYSSQVSLSAATLAQGSTEQAAALEESSATLESVSTITKQTADNSGLARELSEGVQRISQRGVDAMREMQDAMTKIQRSANETAEIVKTIDEIAFQTNLLALNAAVEAARAGDAGKGFAVVAEEVRNLAQRSAQAAKETSERLARSKDDAQHGVKVASEMNKLLEEVRDNAHRASSLVKEISGSSKEQSESMKQINIAITELSAVTQTNSASSEELAAAAVELLNQAGALEERMDDLSLFTKGQVLQRVVRSSGPARSPRTTNFTGTHGESASSLPRRVLSQNTSHPRSLSDSDHDAVMQ